jgi:phosphoribosylaminoimidazole-succinocarboxamide synthase
MNFPAIAAALPATARTTFTGLPFPLLASGKVREIYDLGDALLLVASDRLSAFDVILPDGIPGKGIILTQMSLWWFAQTQGLIQNHLLPDQAGEFARRGINDRDLQLRSMIVRKLKPLTIECVARGYLIGSGWSSYKKTGEVCGIRLPAGLRQADKLPDPDLHAHDQGPEGPARRADQRRAGRRDHRRRALRAGQGPEPRPLHLRPRPRPARPA